MVAWARGPCGVQSGLKPRGSTRQGAAAGKRGGKAARSWILSHFFPTELLSALAGHLLHRVSFFAVCKWEHVSLHRAAAKLN